MTSIQQNVTIYSGDSEQILVTYTDPDTNTPYDISGYSASFKIKKYPSALPIVTKSTGSGIVLTDPSNGVLTISLSSADTASLAGNYLMYLTVTDMSGNVRTIMTGNLVVFESFEATIRRPAYCEVEDVVGFLRLDEKGHRKVLTETTDPKRSEVEAQIFAAEDFINNYCLDSWMPIASGLMELSISPSFTDRFSNELTIPLPDVCIYQLDWTEDDVLEAWNGAVWKNLLSPSYTEGKGKDYYVDYDMGILYLYGFRPGRFSNVVRIKYRSGHVELPYDIKQAAIMLTAVNLLRTDFYNVMLPDMGEHSAVKRSETCSYFEQQAMMLLARHKRCYVRY